MKKLISLLLALCLSVSLAACQGKSDIDENAYDIEGVVEITYNIACPGVLQEPPGQAIITTENREKIY